MKPYTIEPTRVYSVKEVAKILKSNPQTISRYCQIGKIKAKKIGSYKILGENLIKFLKE